MSGDCIKAPDKIKENLSKLDFGDGTVNDMIRTLIVDGEIILAPTTSKDICDKLSERFGATVPVGKINNYMKIFQKSNVVVGLTEKKGKAKRKLWLGSWLKAKNANLIQNMKALPISAKTITALGKTFAIEINALRLVYGKSGDCTAFLLRKILEKAIFLAFAKNSMLNKLENPAKKPKYFGLDRMIEIAAAEKGKDNKPYITPSAAAKLGGVKFLGDSAAHNFVANVEIDEIPHQIPYISVALSELSKKL
jgi:hypothetical protein